MAKSRLLPLAILATLGFLNGPASACTTAVISGRATADGRPLLWKNRDFKVIENEVVHFPDGRYAVTALVNAGARSAIWMGVNSAGLCIENSVSRDLSYPENVSGPGNGTFMLLALKTCATVEEVRQLLVKTDVSGRSTCANFGVIDAHGGAALFEASRNAHLMYDANDPEVAPRGVIVRSNFSLTGQKFAAPPTAEQLTEVYSGSRYLRAGALIESRSGALDARYLLRNCARDLADESCEAYCGTVNGSAEPLPDFIGTKSTLSRTTTVSFAVFHGVKPGEDPLLTTMWLGLGDPKFSIAIPCWVATAQVAGELQGAKGGPLGAAAIALRKSFYQEEADGIRTSGIDAIWTELWTQEDRLLETVERKLAEWRKNGVDARSMNAIHLSAAEQSLAALQERLETVSAQ